MQRITSISCGTVAFGLNIRLAIIVLRLRIKFISRVQPKKLLHLWLKCIIAFVGGSKLLHLWVKCVIAFVGVFISFVVKV